MGTVYIGADVDSKMTELAVLRNGKIIARDRVATTIKALRAFLATVPGRKVMVIEEGGLAGWLYRNLRHDVDDFVVCDPRRNKSVYDDGDKADDLDALELARLQASGHTRRVYHTADEARLAFKEIVALYTDRVREAVRQINKLKAAGYPEGIRVPSRVVRNVKARTRWLADVPAALRKRLTIHFVGLDAVLEQVRLARREMARLGRSFPIIAHWQTLPGIGLVRSSVLFAYLDTPWRFATPKKLWKYTGVGLRRHDSGTDKDGRPRRGHVRLFRRVNRRLKAAVLGAALSAIRQGSNHYAEHYWKMSRRGVKPCNARHTVARKLITVMWGLWKAMSRDARAEA